jgi:hypothetical protein
VKISIEDTHDKRQKASWCIPRLYGLKTDSVPVFSLVRWIAERTDEIKTKG